MWIEPDRFYTIYETAAILNVSRDQVDRAIKKGELPALKWPRLGGKGRNVKKMILGSDLIRFIENHKRAA
jgi:excisionase family DNA binding protein